MKYAYVTKKRQSPEGYVSITKPLARILYNEGKSITFCGNNVNSYHIFKGWYLGYTIQRCSIGTEFESEDFDNICSSFLSYLEAELGKYIVFYTKKENVL